MMKEVGELELGDGSMYKDEGSPDRGVMNLREGPS